MNALVSNLIVSERVCNCSSVYTTEVHHRDFPELRAEGATTAEAAQRLLMELTSELEATSSDWRRASLEKAVGDVQAFLESGD